MAISAMMGMADDGFRMMMRLIGKGSAMSKGGPAKTHYEPLMGKFGKMTGLKSAAQREMNTMGKGYSGAVFGRPMKGLGVGLSHLKGIGYFAAAAGAVESFMAPRGHKASGMVKGVARTLSFAAGDVIGSALGGPLAGMALGSLTESIGGGIGDAFQTFTDFNKHVKHINMGGNFEDSRVAYTMRQRAAQEMGSSVMNARTYLGKEALLLHQ